METLHLSDLIGQEITGVRFCYTPENDEEYSVQSFETYIKLDNNIIMSIPHFDHDDGLRYQITPARHENHQKSYDGGREIDDERKALLIGQKIVDFFFCYCDNEPDFDYSAYIKLTNGYYFTERSHAPMGIPLGLTLLEERQFLKKRDELASRLNIDIRSFLARCIEHF